MPDLGDYVAALRHKKGWSQRELAKRAQFGATTLQQIESGECDPSLATLVAIAGALKVSEQTLIDAWKGKEPDVVSDPQQVVASLVDFVGHLPLNVVMEALCSRPDEEVFENFVRVKGREKALEIMRKVRDES